MITNNNYTKKRIGLLSGMGLGGLLVLSIVVFFGQGDVEAQATCPNNIVEVGEQCDDGNSTNGDGCSNTCQYESFPFFSFPDKNNVVRNTNITSVATVVGGLTQAEPIQITSPTGEYRINSGVRTNTLGTINNNDSLQVRALSSNQFNTPTTISTRIKNTTEDFTIITESTSLSLGTGVSNICGGGSIYFSLAGIDNDNVLQNMSLIHFFADGNDVGGSLILMPLKSLKTPVTLSLGGETRTCSKQLQGVYYNNMRGSRLRPIENSTLTALQDIDTSYNDLSVNGGLYMNCTGGNMTGDLYSVYGQLDFDYIGDTSTLTMGTRLDLANNSVVADLHPNIQFFDNKIPLGYIHDTVGGIGFVGGLFSGNHANAINNLQVALGTVNSEYTYIDIGGSEERIGLTQDNDQYVCDELTPTALDLVRGLVFKGNIGASQATSDNERQSVAGNVSQTNSNLVGSELITNATVRNTVTKNAENLCRGKRQTLAQINAGTPETLNIICIQETEYTNETFTINVASDTDVYDVPVIIRNANIKLESHMGHNNSLGSRPPLQLFVDNGNLYLQDIHQVSELLSFDKNGYPNSTATTAQGVYLEGTIIVNGLILTTNTSNTIVSTDNKRYIHGTLSTLNTPGSVSVGRETQITNMFGAYATNLLPYISLGKTFVGQCNIFNGKFSDTTNCDSDDDKYYYAPLIIIKKDITPLSALLQD